MQLVIKSGPLAGEQYDLGNKPVTLGTDPANEITVSDGAMAGQHARFEIIGSTLYVTDLASDKGTYLNGQRMSPAARYPLRTNDALQIGSTQFQVAAPAPVTPVAAPVAPAETSATEAPLQPYQYQISNAYSPPPVPVQTSASTQTQTVMPGPLPVVAPAFVATPTVAQKKRKINWSAIFATIFVLGLLGGAIYYFINSTSPSSLEIQNNGQITRTTGRPTPTPASVPPTYTVDDSAAQFKGSTPGIGSDKPIPTVQVNQNDVPVYPNARRIDSSSTGVFFTQFITTDSFAQLSAWGPKAFTDKGWSNVQITTLAGSDGAVLTGKKGNLKMVTYLLGPGQKDTTPYDNFFKSANVDPNGSLVVINITNQ